MSTLKSSKTRRVTIHILLALCALVNTVSCRGEPSNGNFVPSEIDPGYSDPQTNEEDTEFGWDLSTDNVEFFKVLHKLNLKEVVTFLENTSNDKEDTAPHAIQRSKRSTFSADTRTQISPSLSQKMPYSATVKISSGCSGTLIGPKYVLTAAHCAFKGINRNTKRKLKVGFLHKKGKLRWRKVRKVYASQHWLKLEKKQLRIKHDYAVLELKRDHRRPFMKPTPFRSSVQSVMRFNGFPGDKQANTMWHTRCSTYRRWRGFLLNHCAATTGTSGAGVYLSDRRSTYGVSGLVVAKVVLRKANRRYKFNVINPLTEEKARLICQWIKGGSSCRSFFG